MEYLQSHGFDKALEMFRQGIADQGGAGAGDADDGGEKGREAIFRAPEPVPIESTLKRNIPQAQTISASTLSDKITPEFEAQAKYIIDQLQKSVEARTAANVDEDAEDAPTAAGKDMMLDVSERIEGYRRYRRWVDDGLDLWKVGLDTRFPMC